MLEWSFAVFNTVALKEGIVLKSGVIYRVTWQKPLKKSVLLLV